MLRGSVAIAVVIFISGCAGNPAVPVSLDKVISKLETDLKAIGYLSLSDLLSDIPANSKAAESYIRNRQCFYGRANPLLLFAANDKISFTLKGIFSEDGSFKITGIPIPKAEVGFTVRSGVEQTVVWPLLPASLSALPRLYFESALKEILPLIGKDSALDDKQKKEYLTAITKTKESMTQKINAMEKTFDPAEHCKKE